MQNGQCHTDGVRGYSEYADLFIVPSGTVYTFLTSQKEKKSIAVTMHLFLLICIGSEGGSNSLRNIL